MVSLIFQYNTGDKNLLMQNIVRSVQFEEFIKDNYTAENSSTPAIMKDRIAQRNKIPES